MPRIDPKTLTLTLCLVAGCGAIVGLQQTYQERLLENRTRLAQALNVAMVAPETWLDATAIQQFDRPLHATLWQVQTSGRPYDLLDLKTPAGYSGPIEIKVLLLKNTIHAIAIAI